MIATLWRDQRKLMVAGILCGVFFIVSLLFSVIDDSQILGLNRWIKPAKFFISTNIFLWTVAIYLQNLKGHERFSRRVSWIMIVIFAIELTAVTGQSVRGVKSHFNISGPVDGIVFAIMGLAIALNTILVIIILYKYFRSEIDLPITVVWGMRLGLIVFLLGSIQGGYMSAQMGHTVGAIDGGVGLPFSNWSTVAGDLRVAHFLGLHALQLTPIFAFGLERFRVSARTVITFAFAFFYVGIFAYTFAEALQGKPLISF